MSQPRMPLRHLMQRFLPYYGKYKKEIAFDLLCALLLTACQQKEVFDTTLPANRATEAPTAEPAQNLFGSTVVGPTDYDDGSYDPASEEGGDWEEVPENPDSAPTSAPVIQSEYAGATPVLIDPVDKPTPTPLPTLLV